MLNDSALAGIWSAVVAGAADRVALRDGRHTLTYRQLDEQVGAIGTVLTGVGPAAPVAVPMNGSSDDLAALLGVMLAGHPVVPVDAGLPPERRQAVIDRAGAATLKPDGGIIPPTPGLPPVALPGCAVLMLTSGSTGQPKAVRQGEAMWRHQITELADDLGISTGHTAVLALPPSFGGGLDIALTCLFTGATLLLADPRGDGPEPLLRLVADGADSLHLSPALLRELLNRADTDRLVGVGSVVTCGEAPDAAHIEALRTAHPTVTYINRAGSSETGNLGINIFPPDRPLPSGTLPPGRITGAKQILGDGSPGDPRPLRVISEVIADGYLVDHRPVDFPAVADGVRRFDLGDTGWVAEGQLHLAGRADDAVKIRGYLVDLSEVVAALRRVDGIADATVIVRGGPAPELVGYAEPVPGSRPPSVATVRAALATSLPVWMQPAQLMLVDRLPRTVRGKIDRSLLPDPPARPAHRPPATRTERLLTPLFEDLLAVPEVGRDDDFLALGGDSLTAVALIDRIAETFGVTLSPAQLAGATTPAAIGRLVDGSDDAPAAVTDRSGCLVDLGEPGDDRPILFLFAGAGESALAFLPLARRLPGFRVIGLQARGLERRALPDWTIAAAARRFARIVRRIDPLGPYRFGGHSLGGVLAMETAHRLTVDGLTVEHIVCLDTVLTGPLRQRATVSLPEPTADDGDQSTAPTRIDVVTPERLWRTRFALLSAGWWPRPTGAQWSLFHELGRRTAMLHRLRAWPGPATVVLAEDNPDPESWWQIVTPAAGTPRRTGGDHNGMLRPHHAGEVAEAVAEALCLSRPSGAEQ